MKIFRQTLLTRAIAGATLALSGLTIAASSVAAPALPEQALERFPNGRLAQSLEKLPPHVQAKVKAKFAELNIPAIDALLLSADETGELYYVEEGLADEALTADDTAETAVTLPPVDVFTLHSKPGAAHTIFLDFDGGLISGRAWGGGDSYDTVPYDLDGNPGAFSDAERARIHDIWNRIADDFSAFDIDVTTEAPASFGPNTGWLLFTQDSDASGKALPSQGAGGVAYVGVWGRSNFTYYQPALVYYNRLGGTASYMAEAGSHEVGHNLGLSHDGTSTQSYFRGLGADNEPGSWAPIMGVGYSKNVTQWSRGEYPDANQTQDDIAIIIGKLGQSQDLEGGSTSPTTLVVDESGAFTATNRQADPYNQAPENKGTVQVGDSDWFQFIAGNGAVTITATPAWDAFTTSARRGANLDIGLRLFDSAGNLVAQAGDNTDTRATIDTSVTDGIYYVEVYGTPGPYASDYGSQGHYYLSGQVAVSSPDVTPPDPNPMFFTQSPAAQGSASIAMQASVATDDRGGAVSYQFSCTSGGAGCVDSGWQTSADYIATGLAAETQYCFTVSARDLSGNTTVASAQSCAVTDALPPQLDPPTQPTGLGATPVANASALLNWTDTSTVESGFDVQREKQHKNGRWQDLQTVASLGADTVSYTDASGAGTFRYRVRAVNASGASAWTNWVQVTVSSGDDGGGEKPCRGKQCR